MMKTSTSAPPAIPDLDLVHVTNVDRELTAIDVRTGVPVWTANDLPIDADVVRTDWLVYAQSASELVGINPRSGTEVVRLDGKLVDARPAAVGEVTIVGTG